MNRDLESRAMSTPEPEEQPDPVVAYVRAKCTCTETIKLLGEHVDTCPVAHVSNLTIAWYRVCRWGTPKREGGGGVTWTCSCGGEKPARKHREEQKPALAPTCRHIRALVAGHVQEVVQDPAEATNLQAAKGWYIAKLTPLGDDILRADWAAKALKDPK
jgi:hypothetical protein